MTDRPLRPDDPGVWVKIDEWDKSMDDSFESWVKLYHKSRDFFFYEKPRQQDGHWVWPARSSIYPSKIKAVEMRL